MRFARPESWKARTVRALAAAEARGPAAGLRLVVEGLRPEGGPAADNVLALSAWLEGAEPEVRAGMRRMAVAFLADARVFPALSVSGIPGGEGFFPQLAARLGGRILPSVPDGTDLRDLVRAVFHGRGDHRWVEAVPDAAWRRLLAAVGITRAPEGRVPAELALAIRVLAHHAASLGLQPEIIQRLPPGEERASPFLALGERVARYLESFDNDVADDEAPLLDEALHAVAACRGVVERFRADKRIHGTSLWSTGLSFRLLAILDRIELLLHLSEPREQDFVASAIRLFKEVVRAEKTREHVIPHVRAWADLLALEVMEHAARKGAKYITSGRRDYMAFLLSSMGGGLLVALFSLAKVVMGRWDVPLAVEALLYGVNYSLCFVLIYLTGATLATKQPAMTANTLARSLGADGHDVAGLESLVVRVWRSQFVSFVGNLVVAFPVALVLSELVFVGTGELVAAPAKAADMLEALHPWRSGAIAYAAFAGVLLFLSGLVSGWVDNGTRYRDIPARIAHHGALLRVLGPGRSRRLAAAVDRNLGVLAGNVFLGFGLGSLGTVGEILGLPLDIRHIAFASAEFGTALEVLRYDVPTTTIVAVGLGVALIGLVNFLVSFSLSLALAVTARGVRAGELRRLAGLLGRHLRTRPWEWFVPPRTLAADGPRAAPAPPAEGGSPRG